MRLRIAGITLLVAAIGGLVGATAAALALATGLLVRTGSMFIWDAGFTASIYLAASAFGALGGAVVGSLSAWTYLRHVPLWRAVGETSALAALGASVGMVRSSTAVFIVGAALGAAVAGIRLRWRYPVGAVPTTRQVAG